MVNFRRANTPDLAPAPPLPGCEDISLRCPGLWRLDQTSCRTEAFWSYCHLAGGDYYYIIWTSTMSLDFKNDFLFQHQPSPTDCLLSLWEAAQTDPAAVQDLVNIVR